MFSKNSKWPRFVLVVDLTDESFCQNRTCKWLCHIHTWGINVTVRISYLIDTEFKVFALTSTLSQPHYNAIHSCIVTLNLCQLSVSIVSVNWVCWMYIQVQGLSMFLNLSSFWLCWHDEWRHTCTWHVDLLLEFSRPVHMTHGSQNFNFSTDQQHNEWWSRTWRWGRHSGPRR